MKILLASYMDFTGPGSMHLYHFAVELERAGHELMVLCYGDPETAQLMAEPARFPIRAVRFDGLGLAADLLEEIRQFGPELVHAWTPRSVPIRVALECRYRFGCRHVIHFEDAEDYLVRHHRVENFDSFEGFLRLLQDPGNWPWKLPMVSALACRYAEAFTAILPAFVPGLERRWRRQARVLQPGVDLRRFHPETGDGGLRAELGLQDSQVVLYSGSIGSMHEFDSLLQAMALLRERVPQAVLVQLGRNLIPQDTDRLQQELGLQDSCRFLGPIPHREIHRYLALGDVLVQCGSPGEFNELRLPSKLPEYLAMGKPVVTFAAGFGRELAEGREVRKVYSGRPEEMAEALRSVLTDPEGARDLGEGARRKAEELFDWERNSRGLIELYRQVLDRPEELRLGSVSIPEQQDVFLHPEPEVRREPVDREIRRVVVITPDPLPVPGAPTSGAGLRAWALGAALREAGLEVVLSMPRDALDRAPGASEELRRAAFDPGDIRGSVESLAPDLAVFCHWPVLAPLERRLECPTVLDLSGPHLLERRHMTGRSGVAAGLAEKLRALTMADRVTCAGHRQRGYFQPFLMASGFDPEQEGPGVIPISMPEAGDGPPERKPPEEPVLVYAGLFLPWQDPRRSLLKVLEVMESRQRGRLVIYGGPHPLHRIGTGIWLDFQKEVASSSRVEFRGVVPFDELLRGLATSSVALDLMERNAERELAFNVRTVVDLWCGLPVIHGDFTELGGLIREYEAGWAVSPEDDDALVEAVERVLDDPAELDRRSRNARTLWRDRLRAESTAEPLLEFVRQPFIRRIHRPLTAAGRVEAGRVAELEIHLRRMGEAAALKDQHIRNLEAFRDRIRQLPPYRLATWLRSRGRGATES